MRGEHLAGEWRILRTIESGNHGATVAELAEQEGCHARTTWRDLAAIHKAGFPLYSEKDGQKSHWGFVEGCTFNLSVPFQDRSHCHGRQVWKVWGCKAQGAAAQKLADTP